MKNKDKLSGVFAPAVTPFDGDVIRYDWLESNIRKMNNAGVKGYLALGSNGEFMSLSEAEQLKVVEVFVNNKENQTIMVGASRESVIETVRFIDEVAKLDVDYVSVLPPHYFAKNVTDDIMIKYFLEVAEQSSLPVLVYNAPGFASNVNIKADVLRRIAEHPNIVGIKDSSPSGIVSFLNATRNINDFSVLAGSADFFYTALMYGATGGIVSLANYLPKLSVQLYQTFLEGDIKSGVDLHFKIFDINQKVSGKFGVAGVKEAMNITGFNGGEPRSPLQRLTREQAEILNKCFQEKVLI
ncbi:dihydrodipicolinate synthase family protein [Bacillus sp. FJAT-50079]|uniref:dihydrodipicolinate synthase family protein n=1 Tax=Bacillus sp. FJAT-50079 TaxID=2833577 RepID=UPI001BCA1443|nr:dihydrodipicolinate synthase family protein [Bacillus sp. FJAT-50079]MBS4208215.1 dihydrodipicolinate synthase family protein [Bacillus sp. FJAT-50079]